MNSTILMLWGRRQRLGGVERRMAELSRSLKEIGVPSLSLLSDQPGRSAFRELLDEFDLGYDTYSSVLSLARIVRRESPMAVVSFGTRQALLAGALGAIDRRRGWLHVNSRNGLDYGWSVGHHAVDLALSPLVDRYAVNSRAVESHLSRHGIPTSKIALLRSAMAEEWLTSPSTPWPRTGAIRFIMVGNVRPEKNQIAGIEAFLEAVEFGQLVIYTDSRSALLDKLSSVALPDDGSVVIHEGRIVSPEDYDRSDVLIHPALSESLPRTVLEAAARGCYIIASDVGDTRTVMPPDRSVLLDRNFSQEDLVRAVADTTDRLSEIRATRSSYSRFTVGEYRAEFLSMLSVR